MSDPIQQALQNIAARNALTADIAVAAADVLIFAMVAAWLVLAFLHRANITYATLARVVALAVVAFVVAQVLGHVVSDTRPYIVQCMQRHISPCTDPFVPVSHDNGFPSDHTLYASFLTASLWWFARRFMPYFAAGTLVVAIGRLAIGAHHTVDVLASMGIVLVVALLVAALPLPAAWERPVAPATRAKLRA